MIFSGVALAAGTETAVGKHGRLRASGNKIVDKYEVPVSLAGNSLFWSNVGWGGEKYWNADVVKYLQNDWKSSIVRAAMGVEDSGGYIDAPITNKTRVKTVVDACIDAGLYVVIDWHSHYASDHQAEAVAFFNEMAQTYGGYDNVIYEIWNEPKNVSWGGVIKPYAEAVIGAIRSHDPDNLIIVGSPTWSTDVDIAAADPINDANVAYSLHFYAGSHGEGTRNKAQSALAAGKPLFISEWGTCDANANGVVNEVSTETWINWIKQNGLSHCNWAINDKAETASALVGGASTAGGWIDADLTASGLLARSLVRGWDGSFHEAEDLEIASSSDGVSTYSSPSGSSGGNAVKLNANAVDDYVAFTVPVPSAGAYSIKLRARKAPSRGSFRLAIDGADQALVSDQFSPTVVDAEFDLGKWRFGTGGAKEFRFTVIGKNASSSGYELSFDSLRLTEVVLGRYEAEDVETAVSSDSVTVFSEVSASNGKAEKLNSNAVNDYVSYTIPITETGEFSVIVRGKKFSTRGAFQLAIDGHNQGSVQDQFGDAALYVEHRLGTKMISAIGDHDFRFTVVGKNANSSGYDLAIDWIKMEPVSNGSEIIMDNSDTQGIEIIGTWTSSSSIAGCYGSNYLHDGNSSNGNKGVRFTPELISSGSYEVFARWTAAANRSNNVPIDIVSTSGTDTVMVNQQQNNGVWVSLGTYTFEATGGSVRIRNTGAVGYVIADAVRFLPVP